jgi:NAD(P)-dependent dehydrogenase (short-subunit alcohol dehydrogenase family)
VGTIAVTGAAGGIGTSTCQRLEADGHRVIRVDVHYAEIIADLSGPDGRAQMAEAIGTACGGVLDGVVAAAGILEGDPEVMVSVNYFGAVATITDLLPMLARGTGRSAVVISSNSTTTQPGLAVEVAEACLSGNEDDARAAGARSRHSAYAGSKLALARWARATAIGTDWAGAGIRLNAIAPGLIDTPMTASSRDFILGLTEIFPIPQARAGRPEEVAGLLAYLLSPDASFFSGSFIIMDGGTDAAVRTHDWPTARP